MKNRSRFPSLGIAIVIYFAAIGSGTLHAAESNDKSGPTHTVIPAFERFQSDKSKTADGRLLLGELNCISCHQADSGQSKSISIKSAPILDRVGNRIKPQFLRKFLANPHATKPGTTMPNVFAGLSQQERKARVEPLVHFLASTGAVLEAPGDASAAQSGEQLFQQIGCFACHGESEHKTDQLPASVPLGKVTDKYTLTSFIEFIRDPLKVRPSGRMPHFNLDEKKARDLANFFFRDVNIKPNLKYQYFEGNWQKLPDFASIKPKKSGESAGFNLFVASRTNNFGIRYQGFIHIPRDGEYTFFLGSDDGSQLLIDGKKVVDVDGIHPYQQKSAKIRLKKGSHPIVVDFFQGGGEWILTVEMQGPGVTRQPVASTVSRSKERPKPAVREGDEDFQLNQELAAKGRELFVASGCASCHQMRHENKQLKSTTKAKPLAALNPAKGCLAKESASNSPRYSLSDQQRAALASALTDEWNSPTLAETIVATLQRLNCYACHMRGKQGGPERERNLLFRTTIKEMGDEGRIPPALDGVGDKLTEDWLRHVLHNGANGRPYMQTNMPKFGGNNIGHLVAAFRAVDLKNEVKTVKFEEPIHRVKTAGRFLSGDKALSCIKCHNFGKYKSTGIQSIDLQTMTKRLRHDWFVRYMLNPQKYRPGTRMPAVWPFGQATITDVLDGNVDKQQEAMWVFLSDGTKAALPTGLIRNPIELVPGKEPIIYRNFIESLNPRGIAVGYPEKANLAFDAEEMSLALIWHGAFIDASLHWNGRGQGFQRPSGDNVMSLVRGVPFAVLESENAAWPNAKPKDLGYQFRGYRLDKNRRPSFRYSFRGVEVEDSPIPVANGKEPTIRRTISLTTNDSSKSIWYRAASANEIEQLSERELMLDQAIKIELTAAPKLRKVGNRTEVLVPVRFVNGKSTITQHYVW